MHTMGLKHDVQNLKCTRQRASQKPVPCNIHGEILPKPENPISHMIKTRQGTEDSFVRKTPPYGRVFRTEEFSVATDGESLVIVIGDRFADYWSFLESIPVMLVG
jgi:hypothetical protein